MKVLDYMVGRGLNLSPTVARSLLRGGSVTVNGFKVREDSSIPDTWGGVLTVKVDGKAIPMSHDVKMIEVGTEFESVWDEKDAVAQALDDAAEAVRSLPGYITVISVNSFTDWTDRRTLVQVVYDVV